MSGYVVTMQTSIPFERIGNTTIAHWHWHDHDAPPAPFEEVIAELPQYGWRVVGEPIENDIPDACRHIFGYEPTLRHFLVPVVEVEQ